MNWELTTKLKAITISAIVFASNFLVLLFKEIIKY